MSYNKALAQELSALSKEIRSKAQYVNLRDVSHVKRNYEQSQTTTQALEEIAGKLETVIAKYFIFYELFKDTDQEILTRQCRTKIQRVLQYAQVQRQERL